MATTKITAAQRGIDYAACDVAAHRRAPKQRFRAGGGAADVLRGPFLAPGTLTRAERLRLLDGIERALDGVYAHLPLKRARYGLDPLQRLRILRAQADALDDQAFHLTLADTLARLRDAHTAYTGPRSIGDTNAVLPFQLEMVGPPDAARYVVTKVVRNPQRLDATFDAGVEVLFWNGVPIDRAVQRWSETAWGGRPDSQRVAALQTLTMRPLRYGPPPDEHWVVVGYRQADAKGRLHGPLLEQRMNWRIVQPQSMADARDAGPAGKRAAAQRAGAAALHRAVNPAGEAARRARMLMFAPQALMGRATQRRGALASQLPDFFKVEVVATPAGDLPLLRIYSFDIDSDDAFVAELLRLLPLLPQDGLAIDIRDNPGGNIFAAERALQLFSARPIVPTRFSVLATAFTRLAAGTPGLGHDELAPWQPSLEAAVRNGELYSRALPITPPTLANAIGRAYPGPTLLVVNANTYSSGDLFTAGYVDHAIGPVVTVGQATAGGGANVLDYEVLAAMVVNTPQALPALPDGVGLTLSFRRATRGGPSEGLPIEDVGIEGDESYAMTRNDVLNGNCDLYARCAATLAKLRR
jgi:C-terminal processing protease CtpA/Prc